jgi:hypothetical protein
MNTIGVSRVERSTDILSAQLFFFIALIGNFDIKRFPISYGMHPLQELIERHPMLKNLNDNKINAAYWVEF